MIVLWFLIGALMAMYVIKIGEIQYMIQMWIIAMCLLGGPVMLLFVVVKVFRKEFCEYD